MCLGHHGAVPLVVWWSKGSICSNAGRSMAAESLVSLQSEFNIVAFYPSIGRSW